MNNNFEQRIISSRDNLFSRLDGTRNNWKDTVSDSFYAMTERADFKGKIDGYISTLNTTLSCLERKEAEIAKLSSTVDALMDVDCSIFSDPSLSFNDSGAIRFMTKGVDLALKGVVVGGAAGTIAIKNQIKKSSEKKDGFRQGIDNVNKLQSSGNNGGGGNEGKIKIAEPEEGTPVFFNRNGYDWSGIQKKDGSIVNLKPIRRNAGREERNQ